MPDQLTAIRLLDRPVYSPDLRVVEFEMIHNCAACFFIKASLMDLRQTMQTVFDCRVNLHGQGRGCAHGHNSFDATRA